MRAFLKKEWMEWVRTGRFFLVLLIFALFGIMNPAIAKLTPWMMEALSDSLAKTGIVTTEVTVDAFTSWTQFYKNIPIRVFSHGCDCFRAAWQRHLPAGVSEGNPDSCGDQGIVQKENCGGEIADASFYMDAFLSALLWHYLWI